MCGEKGLKNGVRCWNSVIIYGSFEVCGFEYDDDDCYLVVVGEWFGNWFVGEEVVYLVVGWFLFVEIVIGVLGGRGWWSKWGKGWERLRRRWWGWRWRRGRVGWEW